MTNIHDTDVDTLVDLIAGSDANLALAAERFDTKNGNKMGTTNGYDISTRVANFDIQTADSLAAKLRTLLVVRLYSLIHDCTTALSMSLDELKPSELAKAHTSLVNSFANLTAPAAKVTFDFDRELKDMVDEFKNIPGMENISVESLKENMADMQKKLKVVK